ncbi:hypothetical protein BD410DRAFT_781279 [Rickenella mellea]|uniref:RBR-type E3 ubiquitin transferase n=1 Tax=Rickenella mellea TaxID=50990 RepID=A0A4Y7QNU3_9AGAM|nr:hypothetical protein BD410DRAFT_781279 [Rickenella mellea]
MNGDELTPCTSLVTEELDVLQSIYPDYIVSDASESTLKLDIPINFGYPRTVVLESSAPGSHISVPVELTHLPPLLLTINLPEDYPLRCPPEILSITSRHSWFPKLYDLRQGLLAKWVEGEGTICNWVEHIMNGEFLEDLCLTERSGSGVVRIANSSPHLLAPLLTNHDSKATTDSFAQNSYACSICMAYLKGSSCLLLSCSHVFCRPCLKDFWSLCIAEGDVSRVRCPDPECVKRGKEADEDDVRRAVTGDEVRRWKWLRVKRDVERDPTIIHCPISLCQAAVAKPKSTDGEESGWDRLRTCQSCGYSFCSFCKRTWHGPLSACPASVTSQVVMEYLSYGENSAERRALERKFGNGVVQKLVRQYEEEQSNQRWFEASTTPCPGCQVRVEKSLGCNHMTCGKCSQHFCYRCGERLNGSDPYGHFSKMGTGCYSKLFDEEM